MTKHALDVTAERDGGVMKTPIKDGEGCSTPGDVAKVQIHYTGTKTDGTVFDTSKDGKPVEFDLGKGRVPKAWDWGIATMRKGEVASFESNAEYAKKGTSNIPKELPSDDIINYEIELISWIQEDLSPERDGTILRTILRDSLEYGSPNEGSTVEIRVIGKFKGEIFDDRDVEFILGEGSEHNICEGIEISLYMFQLYEKSKLEIKSKYAFGVAGKPEFNIPPFADVEYTVKLNKYKRAKGVVAMNATEKLKTAESFKAKGTKYFKEEKFTMAAKMYKRMEEYVNKVGAFSERQEEKRVELKKAMHLNAALCYLKTNDATEAKKECDSILEKDTSSSGAPSAIPGMNFNALAGMGTRSPSLADTEKIKAELDDAKALDPDNEKALFRRGQSYMILGEPELAQRDFERALELDPKNGAASKNIQQCKKLSRRLHSQEKKMYGDMFKSP